MRFATYGRTASLTTVLASRPSGALTSSVQVVGPGGDSLQADVTPTLGAANTTTTAAASAGARTLSLTSVTGVAVGQRYLVGGAESAGGEMVTVSSIASLVVTLAAPLRRAMASGSAFASTLLTIALTTASAATAQRGCRAEFTNPDSLDVVTVDFDVVRWTPRSELTLADVRALDAVVAKRIPSDLWLPDLIDEAWDRICDDLATKDRVPGGFAGTINLKRAHGYLVRALLAETAGADAVAYRDDMRARYEQELAVTLSGLAYDAAQTGAAATGAGQWRGFPLVRS